jgi:hypothetical protein
MCKGHESALREVRVLPERYRATHDLCERNVWRSNGLQADLDAIPLRHRIHLYNIASVAAPDVALQLSSSLDVQCDSGTTVEQSWTDATHWSVEQILKTLQ